jgi:hypothetical protein
MAPQHNGKPHFSQYALIISPSSPPFGKNTNDDFKTLINAWQTSLIQLQTNAVDTPNKLAIVRYSDVLAKKCKVIANLHLAETVSRSLVV